MSFVTPVAWYWAVAPVVVAVLAALLILRGLYHLAARRVLMGSGHLSGGVLLALAALCAGLVILNTQTYARLSYERAVAEVTVAALDPAGGLYRVTVRRLDGPRSVTGCIVRGDEWEMGARVQKWKPWANVLGLDATYTLDQVSNRYFSAARGNGHTITACDLAGTAPNTGVLTGLSRWLMARAHAEQRRFGSAVFMPMADGAIYRVTMTQSGLNAEAVNPVAQQAVRRGI